MKLRLLTKALMIGAFCLGISYAAIGGDTIVPAGQTLTLEQDLLLSGADDLIIAGSPEKPCSLEGQNHQIKTDANWKGQVKISHTRIRNLGAKGNKPLIYAFDLKAGGSAVIQLEHCTFDACAGFRVENGGESIIHFRHNTMLENTLVPQSKDIAASHPVFEASGNSPAPKLFQGNRIYRGAAELLSAAVPS